MWAIHDYVLVDFLEAGDVVGIGDDLVYIRDIFPANDMIVIRGYDDEWHEEGEWEVNIDSILPVYFEED